MKYYKWFVKLTFDKNKKLQLFAKKFAHHIIILMAYLLQKIYVIVIINFKSNSTSLVIEQTIYIILYKALDISIL